MTAGSRLLGLLAESLTQLDFVLGAFSSDGISLKSFKRHSCAEAQPLTLH